MNKNKYYSGINWMRLIAAVLVITIHTSPLASYNTTGDFILTRVIARVAVPFFFMTTGYFTLSRYHYDNRKLLIRGTCPLAGVLRMMRMPTSWPT